MLRVMEGDCMEKARQTILVVDDEPPILSLVAGVLQDRGYDVRTASSRERALKAAEQGRADLVLLDVVMPRTDTSKLARELRARIGHETPIVFLTALPKDEKLLAEVGARDWIEKPFDVLKFADIVEQHLRRA